MPLDQLTSLVDSVSQSCTHYSHYLLYTRYKCGVFISHCSHYRKWAPSFLWLILHSQEADVLLSGIALCQCWGCLLLITSQSIVKFCAHATLRVYTVEAG